MAGESIFFLPFVLARIFRPTVLQFYQISNLELGQCFSIYGITAMVSYFLGGPLADKYPNHKLIATGLWLTAFGGLVLTLFPSINLMYIMYGFWGFSTIMLFWAPLHKTIRLFGGENYQGRSFGGVEAGRGLMAALLGTFSLVIFVVAENLGESTFSVIMLSTSIFIALVGILAWIFIPNFKNVQSQKIQWKQAFTNSKFWILAGIILCAYVGYKITDDYSLYAYEVLGFTEVDAAKIGSSALWLRFLFALIAGFLADRFKASKVILLGFVSMILGGGLISSGVLNSVGFTLLVLAFTLIGVYGIRGIYFAIMQEAAIPKNATGLAIGIMSVIGYTPDVFMSPLMGYLLDNYQGETGHKLVFLVLVLFSLLGFTLAFRMLQISKLNQPKPLVNK